MSVELKLQIELDEEEVIPFDKVVVYKRINAYTYSELAELPLGTTTYIDPAGVINDEYHISFRDSLNEMESLPSHVYRALNPYKQREEEGGPVSVILELETSSTIPTVDFVGVYRRRFNEAEIIRIAVVPIGQQYFQDGDGLPGDVYYSTFIDTTNGAESQPGPIVVADANSGLVVLSGRFELPSGEIYKRPERPGSDDEFDIIISLIVPAKNGKRAPTAQGQTVGITTKKILTNQETGFWSTTIIPNDIIQPNNTYYQFEFRGSTFYKYVNSENGNAQNFAMLAEVQPRYTNL